MDEISGDISVMDINTSDRCTDSTMKGLLQNAFRGLVEFSLGLRTVSVQEDGKGAVLASVRLTPTHRWLPLVYRGISTMIAGAERCMLHART